jgi:hypothetical protein
VRIVVRRVIGGIVGCVALATSLSGCLLPIDAAKPGGVEFTNDSSQDVVVTIEGLGDESSSVVPSQKSYLHGLNKCEGTGIRVETEGGDLLGRVKAQSCPKWTLTINRDGSLDYVKDE